MTRILAYSSILRSVVHVEELLILKWSHHISAELLHRLFSLADVSEQYTKIQGIILRMS